MYAAIPVKVKTILQIASSMMKDFKQSNFLFPEFTFFTHFYFPKIKKPETENKMKILISRGKTKILFTLFVLLMLVIISGCSSGSDNSDGDGENDTIVEQPGDDGSIDDDNGETDVDQESDTGDSNDEGETGDVENDENPSDGTNGEIEEDDAELSPDEEIPEDKQSSDAKFNLSGTIIAPASAAVDSDVNDKEAPYASNDDFDNAQHITNPVTLAGYVNHAGCGEKGRSYVTGDTVDIYIAEMDTGDVISLYIANALITDIDLRLYNADTSALVDESVDTGATESLTVSSAGNYFVEIEIVGRVRGASGASIYNLIIGKDTSINETSTLRLNDEFIPGDILLRFTDESDALQDASGISNWISKKEEALGMVHKKGSPGRGVVFGFENETHIQSAFKTLGISRRTGPIDPLAGSEEKVQQKRDTLHLIKTLRDQENVASAEPNYVRKANGFPDDTYYPLQWHYDMIHLPEAWDYIKSDDNIVVAVVDTGVLTDHPDMVNQLTSDGFDFISQPDFEGNESYEERGGIDENPDDPGDESIGGSTFHGTHVAGIIAAETNNQKGVAGVGWSAVKVMPLRVLGVDGSGTSYDIMQAVRYAAGLENDSGAVPVQRADVINLSLGGTSASAEEQALFDEIREAGVIVVAAAGNDASSRASYPAAYEGIISVSAVDYSSNIAYYSCFGSTIDVAAPGGDTSNDLNNDGYPDGILSTLGEDSSGEIEMIYGYFSGTSMASPHVAGVIALMKSLWVEMGPADVDSLLHAGLITVDMGDSGKDDYYGYGLIDAQKAVLIAQQGTIPTRLAVSPAGMGFGIALSTGTLTLEKLGEDNTELSIISISKSADWLTVATDQIDENGLGTYRVSVYRADLPDGTYTDTIEIISSENTETISVTMRVTSISSPADAGFHHVLLIDAETEETLAEIPAEVSDGVYGFLFTDIDAGEYMIYAGTDLDQDYYIGDVGEVFGAYPNQDQTAVLSVGSDMTGLNFVTEFNINLSDAVTAGITDISDGLNLQMKRQE